jgi:hypothetical protein
MSCSRNSRCTLTRVARAELNIEQVDANNAHARKESELRSPTLSVLFGPVSGRSAVAHDLARAHAMHTCMHTSHNTHGSCSRAMGYGGPSNINTASPSPHPSLHSPSAKRDHPPDPSHHPDPSHTNSNRDSTNKVLRCTRHSGLLKSNRPEDLCFCRRRCSHCGGGARGGHRRRTRPSFGRCLCRRRLGR